MKEEKERPLMVFDGTAWFLRTVRMIGHDLDTDEKIYHCDKPIGGPYREISSRERVPPGRKTTGQSVV